MKQGRGDIVSQSSRNAWEGFRASTCVFTVAAVSSGNRAALLRPN
jgi:Crp-like helix-turn-helix domain